MKPGPQLPLFEAAPPVPAPTAEVASAVVREVFGFDSFRPGQARAIEAFLQGRDALVVLPTGGGKSLCYQVPAIVRHRAGEGPTLVVSPLIALMDDQVLALSQAGVPAVALHSARPREDWRALREEASRAALIYASPERIKNRRFRGWLRELGLAAAAVDEAHCISAWGHDFRPDYMALHVLKRELEVPIIALTATATVRVMEEVAEALGLLEPAVVRGDFSRPNLAFSVELVQGDRARTDRVVELLRSAGLGGAAPGRAVIYAATRKRVQALNQALRAAKLPSGYYHAGRSDSARANAAARFESGKKPILVATTAFGMGIDRPDVRMVIHANAAGSLAAYYQQAGRAGRDGQPAGCVLLYSSGDAVTHARLRGKQPAPGAVAGWKAMQDYVFGVRCRQQQIVDYFTGTPGRACGRCDACLDPEGVRVRVGEARADHVERRRGRDEKTRREAEVVLTEDQVELVLQFVGALRTPLGKGLVAKGLRGSASKPVRRKGLSKNPAFGALRGVPERAVLDALEALLEAGRLARKGRKYPTVWLPDKPVRLKRDPAASPPRPRLTGLRVALRSFRRAEARRRRWKPYQVFDDQTLGRIVASRPASEEELLAIRGLGPKRVGRFGERLLELVRANPA